jgi:GNAT superfamily N-acetyltransferase
MAEFKIRPARPPEAEALGALCTRSKAHWGYDAEFMRLSAASLTVKAELIASGRVVVAEDDAGRVLGVAAVAPMEEAGSYDLDRLFVEPDALRRGVGQALMRAAEEIARAEGALRLIILADPNAAEFYERMGAIRLGDAPSDSIPGRLLPLFRLDLKS